MGIFVFLLWGALAWAGPLEDELIHRLAEAEEAGSPTLVASRLGKIIESPEGQRARGFLTQQLITSRHPGAALALFAATEKGKLPGKTHPGWPEFVVRAAVEAGSVKLSQLGHAELRSVAPALVKDPLFTRVLRMGLVSEEPPPRNFADRLHADPHADAKATAAARAENARFREALTSAVHHPKDPAPLVKFLEGQTRDAEAASFAHALRMTGDPPVVASKMLPLLLHLAPSSDRAKQLLGVAGAHGFAGGTAEEFRARAPYREAFRAAWSVVLANMRALDGPQPVLARYLETDNGLTLDAFRTLTRTGLFDGRFLLESEILAALAESKIPEFAGAREIVAAKDAASYAAALAKLSDKDPVVGLAIDAGVEQRYGAAFVRRVAREGAGMRLYGDFYGQALPHFLAGGVDPKVARQFWQATLKAPGGPERILLVLGTAGTEGTAPAALAPLLTVLGSQPQPSVAMFNALRRLPDEPSLRIPRLVALHAFLPDQPAAYAAIAAIADDSRDPREVKAAEGLLRTNGLTEHAKIEALFSWAQAPLRAGEVLPLLSKLAPRDGRLKRVIEQASMDATLNKDRRARVANVVRELGIYSPDIILLMTRWRCDLPEVKAALAAAPNQSVVSSLLKPVDPAFLRALKGSINCGFTFGSIGK